MCRFFHFQAMGAGSYRKAVKTSLFRTNSRLKVDLAFLRTVWVVGSLGALLCHLLLQPHLRPQTRTFYSGRYLAKVESPSPLAFTLSGWSSGLSFPPVAQIVLTVQDQQTGRTILHDVQPINSRGSWIAPDRIVWDRGYSHLALLWKDTKEHYGFLSYTWQPDGTLKKEKTYPGWLLDTIPVPLGDLPIDQSLQIRQIRSDLSQALLAYIAYPQLSSDELSAYIRQLRPDAGDTPEFWKQIAGNDRYSTFHCQTAMTQLFQRHFSNPYKSQVTLRQFGNWMVRIFGKDIDCFDPSSIRKITSTTEKHACRHAATDSVFWLGSKSEPTNYGIRVCISGQVSVERFRQAVFQKDREKFWGDNILEVTVVGGD